MTRDLLRVSGVSPGGHAFTWAFVRVEMLVVGASRQVNKTTVTTGHLVRTLGGGKVGAGVLMHSGRASRVDIIRLGGS